MGTQVLVTLDSDLKPNYVVSTVAAASFVVGATELAIFIGNAHGGGKSFEVTGLKRCGELIRENGTPTPTAVLKVVMPPPGFKTDAVVTDDAMLVPPTEGEIAIAYGAGFQAIPGKSVTATVLRATEKYIESRA